MYRNGNINFRRRAIDNDFHTDSLNKRQKSRQKGTTYPWQACSWRGQLESSFQILLYTWEIVEKPFQLHVGHITARITRATWARNHYEVVQQMRVSPEKRMFSLPGSVHVPMIWPHRRAERFSPYHDFDWNWRECGLFYKIWIVTRIQTQMNWIRCLGSVQTRYRLISWHVSPDFVNNWWTLYSFNLFIPSKPARHQNRKGKRDC